MARVLQTDLDSLRVEGAAKAARFLLRAWQDRQCQALRDNYGWEDPTRALRQQHEGEGYGSSQLAIAEAVWAAILDQLPSPTTVVQDLQLQYHTRILLDIPLVAQDVRCHYVRSNASSTCGTLLDTRLHHSWACCKAVTQRRHQRIARVWRDLMQQAGWTAHVEQEVMLHMANQPIMKRADIVGTSPEGMRFVTDVRSMASYGPTIQEYLAAEKGKARDYLVGKSQEWCNSEFRALIPPNLGTNWPSMC